MEETAKANYTKKPRHMRRSFKIRKNTKLPGGLPVEQEASLKQSRRAHVGNDDPSMPIDRKVAIVGIGCRYANGIDCVRKFWEVLAKGLDCTTPPPADRFDSSFFLYPGKKLPGKMFNKCAGYLANNPEMFDRQFFKISPEEANQLDPQVRLMLEVVWEGLEDAGIPVATVRGSKTGVYMGVTASEYGVLVAMPNENINQYTNSGTNSCMAANRISYEFDFRGPSFIIDTACSSSLYSIHTACEAIRNGDCDMAVAGGVNISLLPVTSIGFCQAGMLSPDGKSKSFDRSADGYARGEGAGAVILKPLRQALEDGDRVYAVLRGGALHNDGRTPGIANPSFDAQVSLAEIAYKHAMTDPEDVAYVEAHGTGTQIGDRTEANALGEAMSLNRKPEHPPLYIGSVKSNIGHAEGAAGVAGIIKTALSVYYGQIPKVVHFRQGNENVDFEGLNMRVPAELTRWPKGAKKLAGCSSFGFGGANAHLVLEGPAQSPTKGDRGSSSSPPQPQVQPERETIVPMILFLSAASKDALRQRMQDWISYLNNIIGNDSRAFSNALCTGAVRSTHHQYRIGVIARTAREAAEQIRLKVEHDPRVAYNVIEGKTPEGHNGHRLVFVFSGMGTQWWGMARQLMEDEPQFRSVIRRIDKILIKCGAKWSLLHMLSKETDREKIKQTEIAQPCICSVQIALAELFRMRGVTPDAIIGQSIGEVAAAYAAALISLEDAVKLIYIRGRQLRKTSGLGAMVAVLHAVEEVQARLENSEFLSVIDVAAVNSPTQVVLSGDCESVARFVDTLKRDGIRCVTLKVQNAYHSYQQDDIKKDFLKKAKFLETSNKDSIINNPVIPMMSTVTNEYLDRETANSPEYWWKNIRQSVLFRGACEKLLKEGYTSFLEVSPHPSLSPAIRDCLSANPASNKRFVTGSLRRPSDIRDVADDKVNILRSLARLHVEGYPIDLNLLFRDGDFKVMSLPTYPWQRVLCSGTTEKSLKMFRFPAKNHPLLGKSQSLSHFSTDNGPRVWCAKYSMATVPWLRDHKLQGNIVIPAAGQTEIMLAASKAMYPDSETITLRDASFERFIFPSDMKGMLESTVVTKPREAQFALRSFNQADEKWTLHGKASIDIPGKSRLSYHQLEDQFHCLKLAIDDIRRKCPYEVQQEEFYARLWKGGFHLGDTFRCVNTAYFSPDYSEALLYASIPEALEKEFRQYVFHPALLDSMFQGIGICQMFLEQEKARNNHNVFKTWFQVPRSVQKVRVKGTAPSQVAFHVRMTHVEKGETVGDVVAADATNQWVFAQVDRLAFENVHSNEPDEKVQLWRREWAPIHVDFSETALHQIPMKRMHSRPLSAIGSENPGAIIIIKDKQGVSTELKRRMEMESVVSVLDPRILVDGDERFRRVLRSLGQVTDLIMLSTLDTKQLGSLSSINIDNFEEAQTMTATSPISLYRAIVKHDAKVKPRLWMVTRAAHAVHDTDIADPMMAPASAVNLTLMHEDPEFPLVTVDLPSLLDPEESAEWLYQYMRSAPTDENFVALRRKMPMQAVDHTKELAFEAQALRIVMQPQSSFSAPTLSSNWQVDVDDTLKQKRLVVKQNQEAPKVTSSEDIAVRLSAFSVQQQKDAPEKSTGLSYLFAGKINNCSEELQVLFRMRHNVLGLRSGGKIKATIWANASELVPIPANLTPVEAINIVRDYLPAFVAFHDTLKLNENGSVIICLSSLRDRVGLATTHLALEQGANVFLHVETDDDNILPVEKLLGILGDSRVVITSGDNFHTLINDGSVDVLLFAGEMPQDSNNLKKLVGKLSPFGTIVHIHGRNGPSESRLNVMPPNIYFLSIDMGLGRFDQMKPRLQDSMIRLLQMFSVHNGFQALKTLTVPTAPISKLSRSPHATIEDMTVCIDEESIPTTLDFDDINFTANGDAAYLVTGGSRGFGLMTVEWLVKSGARHIYIISRSTPEEEAVLKFKSFRDTGARITHLKVDMSKDHEVEKALAAIRDNEDLPLEGIFHCAVVYNDCHLRQVTTETWNKVMIPKAYGALVLHQLTLKMGFSVRYFVMMSSIVEMLGNEGQGAYCAANTFLASLCSMRRKLGLPATVICPGIINTAGHAARAGFVSHWEKMGMQSLPPSEILKGLGCILATDYPQLGLTGAVNKKEYAKANSPMLSHHFSEPAGTFSVLKSLFPNRESFLATDNDIQIRIRLLSRVEAHELIFKTLSDHLVQRLGLSADVCQEATLLSIGLDSHMSTELSAVIQESFGVTMTAMELLNDTLTVKDLTQNVYTKVMSSATEEQQAASSEDTMGTASHQLWFRIDDKVQKPSHQLVCFPSVGGGPSMFAAWQQHLSQNNVQIISLQMPGWEGRENEKPSHNLSDVVQRLADALLPHLHKGNFSFFGHSLGGLTAFELAQLLWKNHDMLPNHLFISAWYAPTQSYPHPEELNISSSAFRKMQRMISSRGDPMKITEPFPVRFSFLDQSTISNPRLMMRLVPSIEASIMTCKKYRCRHRDRLPCNMTIFGGKNDPFVNPTLLDEWTKQITSESNFKKLILPGKHMYILTAGKTILKEIASTLSQPQKQDSPPEKKKVRSYSLGVDAEASEAGPSDGASASASSYHVGKPVPKPRSSFS
ncbi:phthioceranic/hydroxyphthioceranic acid synthase-like [Asterias rubens]|uniref:phthioceranic/hydroxyphthioceranic acid synthase-like n=1 Tax=Asterias rubens TaxID=7604 RepID=UPI0014550373|nr:phthioceranic/hydroxyphthioceranic acid synthase-like [Asterias rubens]